jgi:emp24/gp25L/p24 family/GOLD
MLRKSHILPFVISLVILASLSGFAQAIATSFSVKAGEDVSRSIDLLADDRVLIEFSVVGEGEKANTVGFSLVAPNGTINDFGEQGTLSFSFVCTEKGQYALHFINQDSTATILVTLECKIDHYVFGMETNLFWLVFIALVCIVGAVGYVVLTKTS